MIFQFNFSKVIEKHATVWSHCDNNATYSISRDNGSTYDIFWIEDDWEQLTAICISDITIYTKLKVKCQDWGGSGAGFISTDP